MTDAAFPLPGVTTVSTIGDWESLFYPMAQSGVVPGVGNELVPSLDTAGRNIVIGTGGAIVRAFYKPVSSSTSTAVPAASSQDRIDRLVLRLDRSQVVAANFVVPHVILGTPGSSPAVPALTQTATGLWDLPVAYWTSKSTGALTGLTDERDFAGGSLSAGSSAGHHVPGRPGLRIDKDTGELLMSVAGTSWDTTIYYPDDPWETLQPLANGWSVDHTDAFAKAHLSRDRTRVELVAGGMTAGTVDGGTVVATLAQKYRPRISHAFLVAATATVAGTSAFFTLNPAGVLACYGISHGASVSFQASIPLAV